MEAQKPEENERSSPEYSIMLNHVQSCSNNICSREQYEYIISSTCTLHFVGAYVHLIAQYMNVDDGAE